MDNMCRDSFLNPQLRYMMNLLGVCCFGGLCFLAAGLEFLAFLMPSGSGAAWMCMSKPYGICFQSSADA